MSQGRSVVLFLVDGSPGGLLTAEIRNWTGHVIAAPRSELAALAARPEVGRTGLYILLGDDPESAGGIQAYIGESDDVGKRLKQHAQPEIPGGGGGKDFWSRAILLTSKDANLTKAHARFLESRFIQIAIQTRRAKLLNGTQPVSTAMLPEADRSDMEYYIEQARIVLPVLGVNVLRGVAATPVPQPGDAKRPDTGSPAIPAVSPERPVEEVMGSVSPLFEIRTHKEGVLANAREIDGEFTVLTGSRARSSWVGVPSGYQDLHRQLVDDGTLPLAEDGRWRCFANDHVFNSTSAAAAVILGRSANGRTEWKVENSATTYSSWQNAGLTLS